jgi:16S rRNA (cytosine967-C5)-methyltransferase
VKLHRHLCQSVTEILQSVFVGGYYADKSLEYHFKNNKSWGARDRRFVAESVYDIVRWWRRLWYALDQPNESSNYWRLLGAYLITKKTEMPDWDEFKTLNAAIITERYENCAEPAVKHSLPDWLYEFGLAQLGDEWPTVLESMNRQAEVVLRANTLKIEPSELSQRLLAEEIATTSDPHYPSALILEKRANVFKTEAFKEGFFEVQDASSQLVAQFLDPKPGERVIDACAGAGGKSLHLAALMKNKGKVISMDVEDRKLGELRTRSTRAGADIIECRLIDSSKAVKRLKETADALLLDVPCSGSGVWKRNPDSKWKISAKDLEEVGKTQRQILEQYVQMLKPGGRLVYATCSVFPSENAQPIKEFLDKNPDWKLVEEISRSPHREGFDGFYMAKLIKPNARSEQSRSR